MFAVHVFVGGEKPSLKFFEHRASARSFADERVQDGADRADIWDLPGVDDARKAMAALRMGEGVGLESKGQHATARQVAFSELQGF